MSRCGDRPDPTPNPERSEDSAERPGRRACKPAGDDARRKGSRLQVDDGDGEQKHHRYRNQTVGHWALGKQPDVQVTGQGVLDVAVRGGRDELAVAMQNLANPMMMKGPIREIIPLSGQRVSVQVPRGKRVHKVKLLVAGKDIAHREENGMVLLEVPSIGLHEVVAVDLG